jgi:hypothetical protein
MVPFSQGRSEMARRPGTEAGAVRRFAPAVHLVGLKEVVGGWLANRAQC